MINIPYIRTRRCSTVTEALQGIGFWFGGVSSNWEMTSPIGGRGGSVECDMAISLKEDALSASHNLALQGKAQFISNTEIEGWFLKQTVRNPSARKTQEAIL